MRDMNPHPSDHYQICGGSTPRRQSRRGRHYGSFFTGEEDREKRLGVRRGRRRSQRDAGRRHNHAGGDGHVGRGGIPGDFRFVLINRVFSPSSICNAYERRIMAAYETLRHISESTENALGLDTSVVTVETVPLVIRSGPETRIRRTRT